MRGGWTLRLFTMAVLHIGLKANVCLTWEFYDETDSLLLKCKVTNLKNTVSFYSPDDQIEARCEYSKPCKSVREDRFITQNKSTHETFFEVNKISKNPVDGNWTCFHGASVGYSFVSTSKGKSNSIFVSLEGLFDMSDTSYIFKLTFSSCWSPVHNAVEFLVNHTTKDSVIYDNGICIHQKGHCRPDTCSCKDEENTFTWIHEIGIPISTVTFSCEARFEDILDGSFKKYIMIIFQGKDFIPNGTYTEVVVAPRFRLTSTKVNSGQTTVPTSEKSDTLSIVGLISSLVLVAFILVLLVFFLYRKLKKKINPNTEDQRILYPSKRRRRETECRTCGAESPKYQCQTCDELICDACNNNTRKHKRHKLTTIRYIKNECYICSEPNPEYTCGNCWGLLCKDCDCDHITNSVVTRL